MTKQFLVTGSILAALSVALGALAAHWLKANISPANVLNFDTAARYQMYHALAILLLAALPAKFHIDLLRYSYYSFLTGVIFFSGSIYLLATREITGLQISWIGPVTPIGGLLFISGWVLLIFATIKVSKKSD
jgi:uncharacterized membrane protein YgdD (TMEM256/DUF423 family)